MERQSGTRVLAIIAIFIAVIGMTIGFASFSTILRIEGTGEVKGSNWTIEFADLEPAVTTGTAREKSGGTPTIQEDSTTISNYQVELMTPGDSISYTFKIKNRGTYDAEILAITMAGRTGTPFVVSGGDATDQANVKDKLLYTLTYVGGDNDGNELAVGDILPKQTEGIDSEVKVKLTLKYLDFEDEMLLPKSTVTIDNLGININYGQS